MGQPYARSTDPRAFDPIIRQLNPEFEGTPTAAEFDVFRGFPNVARTAPQG